MFNSREMSVDGSVHARIAAPSLAAPPYAQPNQALDSAAACHFVVHYRLYYIANAAAKTG
jgi:hypothetical protein